MDHLLTEARNPASTNLDELTPIELVRLMNAEDARVIPAVAAQAEAIARAIEVTAERLRDGGRLVYVGAGTSGRLGVLDAAECPPTFNSPSGLVVGVIAGGPTALTTAVEGAEDRPDDGARDLAALSLGAKDVVVGIATSGRTPYVCGALTYARSVGAFTIGLACTPHSELVPLADLMIEPLVGPEVLTGSTRLKAGTATKLILNTLSTGVMVRLGKAYGNLMVDLRATNTKLRARTNRIVRHFTDLSVEEADALLQRCGGELKTALVAHGAGLTPEEARERLGAVGGQVRQALPPRTVSVATDLVLGVDGGGTGTVALLSALRPDGETQVLGRGVAGPSNIQAVGPERAIAAIDEAVAGAFAAAGRERVPVAAASLGLAGAGRPEDQEVFCRWAQRIRLAERVEVVGDVELLLAAGTPEGWGIALVAGTGSIAWGRTADGRTARAGGWGPLLGDEGSAYWLALTALASVARWADGRQRDGDARPFAERLLRHLQVARLEDLIPLVHRQLDRAGIAALAPLVLDAAVSGDLLAVSIMEQGAVALAGSVVAVARSLGLTAGLVPLALAGGPLTNSAMYRECVLVELERQGMKETRVAVVPEPAEGAVRRALALSAMTR